MPNICQYGLPMASNGQWPMAMANGQWPMAMAMAEIPDSGHVGEAKSKMPVVGCLVVVVDGETQPKTQTPKRKGRPMPGQRHKHLA
jgi:hypothetical protein